MAQDATFRIVLTDAAGPPPLPGQAGAGNVSAAGGGPPPLPGQQTTAGNSVGNSAAAGNAAATNKLFSAIDAAFARLEAQKRAADVNAAYDRLTNTTAASRRLQGEKDAAEANKEFEILKKGQLRYTFEETAKVAGKLTGAFAVAELTIQSFISRGKELAMYSGALAGANAQADIRSMMSDIREAQELGPSLAALTTAQSQMMAELREILLPIKRIIIDVLVKWLDGATLFMSWIQEAGWPAMMVALGTLIGLAKVADWKAFIAGILGIAGVGLVILGEWKDKWEAKNKKADADEWSKWFEDQLNDLANRRGQMPVGPIPDNQGARLNIPAFQGL